MPMVNPPPWAALDFGSRNKVLDVAGAACFVSNWRKFLCVPAKFKTDGSRRSQERLTGLFPAPCFCSAADNR